MKKVLLIKLLPFVSIISFMLVTSCSNAQQNKNAPTEKTEARAFSDIDSLDSGLQFIPKGNYATEKSEMISFRKYLYSVYKNLPGQAQRRRFLDSVSVVFTDKLLNDIVPYWYGTKWDFNGYTAVPNQGEIACGYFVSTTLRDMDLKLNRYKMAQQAALNEAKSLGITKGSVKHYNRKAFLKKLSKLQDGLYLVGLDYHVGYLYVHNKKAFFIHSNFIDGRVMIEDAIKSEAFVSNQYYYVNITHNIALMKKWLKNERVKIVVK